MVDSKPRPCGGGLGLGLGLGLGGLGPELAKLIRPELAEAKTIL